MSDEVVVIRVEHVNVSEGGKFAVMVGTRRYGNTSAGSIYPRFRNRTNANRVGSFLRDTYVNEGMKVEFTPIRQRPGRVIDK
jgi:hypothetical protein